MHRFASLPGLLIRPSDRAKAAEAELGGILEQLADTQRIACATHERLNRQVGDCGGYTLSGSS